MRTSLERAWSAPGCDEPPVRFARISIAVGKVRGPAKPLSVPVNAARFALLFIARALAPRAGRGWPKAG